MSARLERIHLDAIGGIAGDMFVSALVDAFPECIAGMLAEVAKLPTPEGASVQVVSFSDGMLSGRRFVVQQGRKPSHTHASHREIQHMLRGTTLEPEVLGHALAMFGVLATAEATVHGIAPDEVEFHEVGAWDSIVDFVAAAYLIARLSPERWSWSALPLGGGRVKTAHGLLPLPAPATSVLLRGMEVIDDGVGGERVTPTGAAILAHLRQQKPGTDSFSRQAEQFRHAGKRVCPQLMGATGNGFGSRKLPGISNVLRCIAFTPSAGVPAATDDEIATLQFEIDDQTAEDLAVALDRVRAEPGVLEVYQVPAFGKKGRLATQVQILARVDAVDRVSDLCLSQTTTLGLRIARVARRTLVRAGVETAVPELVRVKVAARPSGEMTAKAEMDDLARIPGGRVERELARERAERQALEATKPYEPGNSSDD